MTKHSLRPGALLAALLIAAAPLAAQGTTSTDSAAAATAAAQPAPPPAPVTAAPMDTMRHETEDHDGGFPWGLLGLLGLGGLLRRPERPTVVHETTVPRDPMGRPR